MWCDSTDVIDLAMEYLQVVPALWIAAIGIFAVLAASINDSTCSLRNPARIFEKCEVLVAIAVLKASLVLKYSCGWMYYLVSIILAVGVMPLGLISL